MWTQFMDMHSGGGQKLPWEYVYIEAPEEEAAQIFFNRFGRNPHRVTCTCCGPDYSLSSEEELAQLTAYHRGCAYIFDLGGGRVLSEDDWYELPREERIAMNQTGRYVEQANPRRSWAPYQTLEDFMKRDDVTFIPASHIKPEERGGSLPAEGYVWAGD